MRRFAPAILIATTFLVASSTAHSHCQIPCGIYDDELRVELIEEHITTIEKSIAQLQTLSKASPANYNQIVRWVDNKEHHAQEIQDIVTAYFMAQRIKAPEKKTGEVWDSYVEQLTLLHQIQVAAMKAKQTADSSQIAVLQSLVQSFREAYFGEEGTHGH